MLTGGSGSFGSKFIEIIQKAHPPKKLMIFSRDELKQYNLARIFNQGNMRYLIGDVRDKDRLRQACYGVDIIIHAAALKQVPAAEYNPFEAVKTNIIGAQNVIEVAIEQGVKKVIALSTDKAVNPVNLYGATKLCSDRIFIAGNVYTRGETNFSVVRYGNVMGSRGSVIPLFLEKRKTGILPITDERMTRFWITLSKSVEFVLDSIQMMKRGEIFVPKIPSMKVVDLAKAMAPECKLEYVGIRPGEKLHEVLVSEEEARHTLDYGERFLIKPDMDWMKADMWKDGQKVPEGFSYKSDTNPQWLSVEQMRDMLKTMDISQV